MTLVKKPFVDGSTGERKSTPALRKAQELTESIDGHFAELDAHLAALEKDPFANANSFYFM